MMIVGASTHKLSPRIRKILLIQLGDIGDVVWTTPSIWAVKKALPDAHVCIMVKEGFGGLLEADPSVAQVIEAKRPRGNVVQQTLSQLLFLKGLRDQHFDLAMDLRLGDRGAFLAFATGAPLRMTMHHPAGVPYWRKFFFTHAIVPDPPIHRRGATDQSLRLLRKLGIDSDDIVPRLWVAEPVKRRVREILTQEGFDHLRPWITVNPFARWSYKEWNQAKWIGLFHWFWDTYATPILVIGAEHERSRAEALVRQSKAPVINLAGTTTLPELAGLLSLSHLHIGVDSAAPHIAAATGTPTVTIYGPSSWEDWAPIGDRHRVVLPAGNCISCRQKGCDDSERSRCLEELGVDEVQRVIAEAMAVSPGR